MLIPRFFEIVSTLLELSSDLNRTALQERTDLLTISWVPAPWRYSVVYL